MSSAGPPRELAIARARSLGPVPTVTHPAWKLVGQDGGQSIDLGDGRTLFVFSDTLLAPADRPLAPPAGVQPAWFLANCAAVSGGATLQDALQGLEYLSSTTGWPREVLTATREERKQRLRFWPEHGLALDGAVYLYYLGIEHLDPAKTWAFRNAGCGLARLDLETGQCERVRVDGDWVLWPATELDLHFGVQTLLHAGQVLVFATLRQDGHHRARLFRVAPSRITEPRAYEVLTSPAPTWGDDPRQGLDLGPCSNELSVSFNPWLGRYLMSYAEASDRALYMRTADAPWGPWSEPRRVGGLPHEPGCELVYLAFEHPRFALEQGRTVLVSYCQPHFTRNRLLSLTFR